MSCIENGHNFQIIRHVRDLKERNRIKRYIECMECGEERIDYISEDEVDLERQEIEDFEDDDEKVGYFINKSLEDIGAVNNSSSYAIIEEVIFEKFDDFEKVTYDDVLSVANEKLDMGYLELDEDEE